MNRPGGTSRGRILLLDAVLVAIAALVILVPVLELWDAEVDVPLAYVRGDSGIYSYEPDVPFYQMLAKGGIDHAWFSTNANLGAPFEQELFDFPVSLDNLNLVGLKVLGTVTGSVGATVNIFFVLTFAAVAVAMLLVLRALGVSRAVAAVIALLYTFLPYHFARGVPHLFLSAYWVVPLAGYLVLRTASRRPPFTTEATTEHAGDGQGWRVRLWNRSGVLWLLACVAIASSGAYYAAFTVLFVVILAGVDFIARRNRRVLASAAISLAAILGMAAVNLAPSLVYFVVHGQDTEVVRRNPSETELNGLKVAQLVLPVEHHRVSVLADVQAKSTRFTPTRSERGQQLGIIGALGFVGLLVVLLVAIRRRTPTRSGDESDDAPVPPPADALLSMGVLTVAGILLATISGFSILIFGIGIRELRSWNRISVFLAFFALTAVAYALDWLRRRLPARRWTAPAVVIGLVLLLVLGILDQVSPAVIPDYASTQARWNSDADFVARIERRLPDGASVFELPYRAFPEAPKVGTLGPYDLVRPYLHSDSLKWGWGGMLGREADWQVSTAELPAREMLDRLAAVGFDGLVDDLGSTYHFKEPFPNEISAALGRQPVVSRDGELAFWDLREDGRRVRARLGPAGVRRLRKIALADRTERAQQ